MKFGRRKRISVDVDGRAGLVYREGDHTLLIDSEMLAGGEYDLVVYSDSIKSWAPPFETEELSEADCDQIKENVTQELKRYRIDWQ